jgi:cyanuric acid amidohydrolase
MKLSIDVFRPEGPADTTDLSAALARLPIDRIKRLVVLGKTEGPASLNDFSRDLAQSAVDAALRDAGGDALLARSMRVFSTGCEGIATPIVTLIAEFASEQASGAPGLAIGFAASKVLPDGERAGRKHIEAARQATADAIQDAGLSPNQVSLVLIKSPIQSVAAANRQGANQRRHGGSTGSSRGAAAIGAGIALNEIDVALLDDDPVGRAPAYARRVMAFSGTEVDRIETIVIGARPGGDPAWDIRTVLTKDLADTDALRRLASEARGFPVLLLFKAGIPPNGRLRGRRTTVFTSELTPDKQLRAASSGVIAGSFGSVDTFISAGAEHLGRDGACLCALITKTHSGTSG